MKMSKIIALVVSHAMLLILGFVIGIYTLPILIAPESPSSEEVREIASTATYHSRFKIDLEDSDSFHWGEGGVSVGERQISFIGELAPGPDYKLYLSPEFVETEADFKRLKSSMVQVADVKTFDNFIVNLSPQVNIDDYNSVIIWCEHFSEFITAAQYRER